MHFKTVFAESQISPHIAEDAGRACALGGHTSLQKLVPENNILTSLTFFIQGETGVCFKILQHRYKKESGVGNRSIGCFFFFLTQDDHVLLKSAPPIPKGKCTTRVRNGSHNGHLTLSICSSNAP